VRQFVSEKGLQDVVRLLPFMPRSELVQHIGAADVCFASLRDTPNLQYAIPTKILEYLACGKPVLAALSGLFADLLRQENAAVVCPPGDPVALSEAILGLIGQGEGRLQRLSPREFVVRRFSTEQFEERMLALFETLGIEDGR